MRYKGKYRLRTPYDKITNMFPREYNGQFAENDVYIECQNKVTISSFGHGILECYIPSIGRGHNIIKAIKHAFQDENIILKLIETDEEVIFQFHAKYIEQLEPYLKPKKSGANISPFSSRNLPKNKTYKIPDEDLSKYKQIISKLNQNELFLIGRYITEFINTLVTKRNSIEIIKNDMAKKQLRGKEYIHSIGEWNNYLDFLNNKIISTIRR